MKRWITRWPILWAGVVLAFIPGLAISAIASSGTPTVTGTFRDGPYAATTPDSGSCGNNWAIDLFSRQFLVHPENTDGTWTVVEKFNSGKFISLGDGETGSAVSPGHCDPDLGGSGGNTHMLREGVSGSFSGSFTIVINAGFTYAANKGCNSTEGALGASTDDGCTTGQWISLAFPGATYGSDANVTTYSLTYHANTQTWIDSSSGDSGDIYTSS